MLKSIFMGITLLAASMILGSCGKKAEKTQEPATFVTIQGQNLIKPDGSELFIMGTNLGNWLNPEGYMFKFNKTNSPRFINEMFCQLVGPDFTAEFWKAFKDNYITGEDIRFIKSTGANTVRLPFHYKLFTDEDFMGLTANQDGFTRIDSVVKWCRESGLYLILDMHDAPGGQTGDNIDDSYGYPWLFES
ncbi:MAG: glycoside hydrolase family 5 protein, partial [Odoribacter splanchnicus]|nr:glycoside hydrolase family 5 protein [Odoribacter splanchnicus]